MSHVAAVLLALVSMSAAARAGDGAVNVQAMAEDRFWALIDQTVVESKDQGRQLEALRTVLRQLTAAEIEAFELAFQAAQARAYTWDLVYACKLMSVSGLCSDDGFEYFQRWLISRGRTVFETAVADPDSLADAQSNQADGLFDFEDFAYVAAGVWSEKTGINPWKDPKGRFPYTGAPPSGMPAGHEVTDDRELAKRFPKLWARFRS
jgi:Protein of unknown function (DUF4240)